MARYTPLALMCSMSGTIDLPASLKHHLQARAQSRGQGYTDLACVQSFLNGFASVGETDPILTSLACKACTGLYRWAEPNLHDQGVHLVSVCRAAVEDVVLL
jgi:hypothetical protein